jgi:dTDP-glucose 4,6-dehydratase
MDRLLVTGGAGFIGSNFAHYWLREHPGERLVVLDALTYAGNLESLHAVQTRSDLRFVHGQIQDGPLVERLLREERINTIVHFAGESHVDRSIHAPDAFIEANIVGTHSLLKAARKVWIDERTVSQHRFHHVSTDEVYGALDLESEALNEQAPYAPDSPYAASKAASDHFVRAYCHTYGLQATRSNCSNNYGPYHFPEKLIPLAILALLHGRAVPIYGSGRNRRDWLHVSDHCRAIDLILQKGKSGELYNIGGGAECENAQLVRLLCEIVDDAFRSHPELRAAYPQCPAARGAPSSTLVQFVRDRPGHNFRYAIDCRKIQSELGYQPQVSLEKGLRDTLLWYAQNEWWWQSVMDGPSQRWIDSDLYELTCATVSAERSLDALAESAVELDSITLRRSVS